MKRLIYISITFLSIFNSCKTDDDKFVQIAGEYFFKEQYQLALENYLKAIDLNNQNKSAIHDAGRCYEELGNFEQAIVYYTLAINVDSLYAKAYRSRGFAQYKTNDFENALRDYQKSLKIEPNNATAYSNSGAICEELCDIKMARDYYYKTLELNPDHYGVMTSLADIEFDLANYKSCIDLCYKAIGNLDENKDSPHATLGLAYTAIEKYDSAIVQLTIALDLKKDCHTFNNRGYALSCLDKYQEAILDFNLAIKLDSLVPAFYLNRADAFYGLKKYKKAILDYDRSIEISSLYENARTGIIFNNRAYAKKALGDINGYNMDIKKAKDQGYPNSYRQFSNLVKCNYQ